MRKNAILQRLYQGRFLFDPTYLMLFHFFIFFSFMGGSSVLVKPPGMVFTAVLVFLGFWRAKGRAQEVRSKKGIGFKGYLKDPKMKWVPAAALGSALISIPVIYYFVRTWGESYPLCGDHLFHLFHFNNAAHSLNTDIKADFRALFHFMALFLLVRRWPKLLIVYIVLVYGVFSLGNGEHPVADWALRYPAGHKVFDQLIYLSFLRHHPSFDLLLQARFVNVVAAVVMLFSTSFVVLAGVQSKSKTVANRLLVWFAFLALLFTNPALIYWFTSSYLEAWCLVFVALTLLVAVYFEFSERNLVYLFLLAGAAAFTKEPAILLVLMLPGFFLLQQKERLSASLRLCLPVLFSFYVYLQERKS